MMLLDCYCEYASRAPGRQGGLPSLHQKLVDIPYQIWFQPRLAAVFLQSNSILFKYETGSRP